MSRQRFGLILCIGVLLALLLAACGAEAPAPEQIQVTVEVESEAVAEEEPTEEAEPTEEPAEEPTIAPAAEPPTEAPAEEAPPEEEAADEEAAADAGEAAASEAPPTRTRIVRLTPTRAASATPTSIAPSAAPSATAIPEATEEVPLIVEERLVELEWPPEMRLGDSDIVRLSLLMAEEGYVVEADFPEHDIVTGTVEVEARPGYDLFGIGRLDGAKFDISPQSEQEHVITSGEGASWQWTIAPHNNGQHRLAVSLMLRWLPQDAQTGQVRESTIYDKGLTVQVTSFMGLTTEQAMRGGLIGLLFGGGLTLPFAFYGRRSRRESIIQKPKANPALIIEHNPLLDTSLTPQEETLLRTLFHLYARITLEAEFRSGYSGARIFLVLPLRADGRADAYTIAKLGERADVEQEFQNYETFVKHTLPPITARILDMPVTLSSSRDVRKLAAVRYTFIGEAGRMPMSLRQTLLNEPNPALLERLFQTFGPNWWMQRRPYTFRLAQEYDRMLPSHYMLEPVAVASPPAVAQKASVLDGNKAPTATSFEIGEVVKLCHVQVVERHLRDHYLSLRGETIPGHPPLRLRLYSEDEGELRRFAALSEIGATGISVRIRATRQSLLSDYAAGFELYGLPDPLLRVPALFNEQVFGTQSPIHGDLNLENVLVGLGDFVWLIDFALTREGHTLYDFAHLGSNLIAHVIVPHIESPEAYLELLRSEEDPLLKTLHSIASRCLFNPEKSREFHLALFATCIGALKYRNLNSTQKHLLYLTAAYLGQSL